MWWQLMQFEMHTTENKKLMSRLLDCMEEANLSMQGNDSCKINDSIDALQNAAKAFNSVCEEECYRNLLSHPNPMEMAIRQLNFSSIKIVKYKDKISAYKEYGVKNKTKQIIPSKLNEFAIKHEKRCLFPSRQYRTLIERLNQLLAYREAKNSRFWTAPKKLLDNYYVHQVIKEEESGNTPLSNKRLLRDLQDIANVLLFIDNGNGYNKIRMYSHDIWFLINFCPNVDLSLGKIRLPKTETLESIIAFLMHRHLDGEKRFDAKIQGLVKNYDYRFSSRTKISPKPIIKNRPKEKEVVQAHTHQTETRSSWRPKDFHHLPSGRDAMMTN